MSSHRSRSRWILVGALIALFAACSTSSGSDEAGSSSNGSTSAMGDFTQSGGALLVGQAGVTNGSTVDGSGNGSTVDGSGNGSAVDGSGSSGTVDGSGGDVGTSGAGTVDGSGSSGPIDGSGGDVGNGGAGSVDASGGNDGNEGGRTFDVGSGGTLDVASGGTLDLASGGTLDLASGGTLDLASGGTLDLASGGTIDLASGGTIDLGSGGTIDTCIPTCVPDLLGFGEEAVNLVVFENATASGCDTEGRMWVGGDANLSGYGVGAQLSACDAEGYVLVVGGDLAATGGIKGRIWVGGDLLSGTAQCGGVWGPDDPPVDFEFVKTTLQAYSRLLGGYPVNGTTSVTGNGATVFSGTDPDINVFTISGADMLASNGFVIDTPSTATVIINVTGPSAGFVNGTTSLPDGVTCGSGAVKLDDFCNQLVWNFPEATSVSVSGTAVQGTILAPFADFGTNGSGQVNGTVIVNNFEIEACVEMHPHYFNGCLCTEEIDSPYACCP